MIRRTASRFASQRGESQPSVYMRSISSRWTSRTLWRTIFRDELTMPFASVKGSSRMRNVAGSHWGGNFFP